MSNSLQYTTIQSNEEVLRQLYRVGGDDYFPCRVAVVIRELDSVEDGEVTLYVRRKVGPADFEHANGDKVYKTVARLAPEGRDVDVDVTIHARGNIVYREEGATITMDDSVREASDEVTLDRLR